MSTKTISAPHLGPGKTVKLGRRRPKHRPRLRFGDYIKGFKTSLRAAPSSATYTKAALPALRKVYLNDTLGDCVIAGGYHILGTATGNAGDIFEATDEQIVADYHAIGGYVLGDESTDNGCDEETALQYWSSTGLANGCALAGWASVDATNIPQIQSALWLFENLMFGVELPDAWIQSMPSSDGFTWGVAGESDPDNGHCFIGAAYDESGVTIDTWGLLGTVSYDAIAEYAGNAAGGELYVLLTPDMLAKGQTKAPNGIDWTELLADMQALRGQSAKEISVAQLFRPSPSRGPVVEMLGGLEDLPPAARETAPELPAIPSLEEVAPETQAAPVVEASSTKPESP